MTGAPSTGNRRLVLAIFLLALLVRAMYFAQIQDTPFFLSPVIDAMTYHHRALEVAAGQWHESEVFWQPPLYPTLLGVFYAVFGTKIALARLFQLFLGATICVMVALLAQRLFGRLAAWTAGVAAALCGTMIFFEAELLNPVLSIALNMGALLLLIPEARNGTQSRGNFLDLVDLPRGRWLAAGVLLGLSAISRPDILLFAGLVALAPLLARKAPRRERWARPLLLAVAVLVPILPVTAHNVVYGGEWVPISSNFGVNFYLGNSGEYDRTVGVRPGLDWQQLMLEPVLAGVPENDAGGASAWWTSRAVSSIREAPGQWLADVGRKAGLGLTASETGRNVDLRFFARFAPLLDRLPGWGLIFPLGAVGALIAVRLRRAGILLAYLGCYVLTLLVFFVSSRYRLPMLPVLAILAGLAVERAVAWWQAGSRARTLGVVAAVLLVGVLVRSDRLGAQPVDEADGHYLVAKALSNRDEHHPAIESLQKTLRANPRHWDALFDLAAAWKNVGQPQRAIPLYEQILDGRPEDHESLLALAETLDQLRRPHEAADRLRKGAASRRATPQLTLSASRSLFALGRVEEAEEVVVLALERGVMQSDLEEFLVKVQQARAERKRLALCMDGGIGGVAPPPADPSLEVLTEAGRQLAEGRHLEAELAVSGLLSDCAESAESWSLLGKLWYLQGSPQAEAALRHAIGIDPGLAEAYLGLAHALAADRQAAPEAVAALEKFLELVPYGPEADSARRALASLPSIRRVE